MADFSSRLARVSRLMKSESERRLAAHGVHAGQQFVLACLWEEDGLTPGDLAQRIGVEPGTVTRALRRMTAAGLVERRGDEADRRRVRVWLTARGRDLRDVLPAVTEGLDADAVSDLSAEESEQLLALLDRVHGGLSARRS